MFSSIVLAAKRSLQHQKSDFRLQIFAFKLNENCLCIGQTSGFYEFITNFSGYTDQLEPLCSITMLPQFASIKHLYIIRFELTLAQIEHIKPILPQLEVLRVQDCRFESDFYGSFVKYCVNLKWLCLENIDLKRPEFLVESVQNHWLHQEYPLLDHFKLTPRSGNKIIELKRFFEQNPNIRSFSISSFCLYENWLSLIDTKANLDVLFVDFNCWPRIYLDSIRDVLNFLHRRGFYKKLHLNLPNLQNLPTDDTASLKALEKLHIKRLKQFENLFLLMKVNELVVSAISEFTDVKVLAMTFVDLKRIYLKMATSDDIIAFIRYSPNLREIHVETLGHGSHFYGRILDVVYLNKERKKLEKAQKVKVFVNKKVVNASKSAVDDHEFSYVNLEKINFNAFHQKFEF
ncbi:uncharacterized protein LOC129573437 [Sitodiplosis mosellana]|uniref:uncharacterized protein LOC129573437 n=1 Tax=Sitodiplosis mosellana TaxID=263140 RepID=UPI0024438549|nr:uncharacterized protein LOC129573437 [Sitodiplosis mosellana]